MAGIFTCLYARTLQVIVIYILRLNKCKEFFSFQFESQITKQEIYVNTINKTKFKKLNIQSLRKLPKYVFNITKYQWTHIKILQWIKIILHFNPFHNEDSWSPTIAYLRDLEFKSFKKAHLRDWGLNTHPISGTVYADLHPIVSILLYLVFGYRYFEMYVFCCCPFLSLYTYYGSQ